jgi:hypothetical protein
MVFDKASNKIIMSNIQYIFFLVLSLVVVYCDYLFISLSSLLDHELHEDRVYSFIFLSLAYSAEPDQ